jgi:hypothetical protein
MVPLRGKNVDDKLVNTAEPKDKIKRAGKGGCAK